MAPLASARANPATLVHAFGEDKATKANANQNRFCQKLKRFFSNNIGSITKTNKGSKNLYCFGIFEVENALNQFSFLSL